MTSSHRMAGYTKQERWNIAAGRVCQLRVVVSPRRGKAAVMDGDAQPHAEVAGRR